MTSLLPNYFSLYMRNNSRSNHRHGKISLDNGALYSRYVVAKQDTTACKTHLACKVCLFPDQDQQYTPMVNFILLGGRFWGKFYLLTVLRVKQFKSERASPLHTPVGDIMLFVTIILSGTYQILWTLCPYDLLYSKCYFISVQYLKH